MTPETLTGHAQGCESLAAKFGQLAELLHQARVDDKCFGELGVTVGLFSGYYTTIDECRNQAARAQEFLHHTKASLDETVKEYEDTERRISESLQAIHKELEA